MVSCCATDHDLVHPDPILAVMMNCRATDHDLAHSDLILAVMMSCFGTDDDLDHPGSVLVVMMRCCARSVSCKSHSTNTSARAASYRPHLAMRMI